MGLIRGNLRTGRHQACRVKSELNLTYAEAVTYKNQWFTVCAVAPFCVY